MGVRWRLLACVGVLGISVALTAPAYAQSEPATLGFTLSPTSGPPGTRVRFEGNVPVDSPDFSTYQSPQFAHGLDPLDVPTNPSDCNLIVDIQQVNKVVTDDGHITGSFVVGRQGGCFMSDTDLGPQPARPGVYAVLLGCHACTPAGTFTITSPALARTGTGTLPTIVSRTGLIIIGVALVSITRRQNATPRTHH